MPQQLDRWAVFWLVGSRTQRRAFSKLCAVDFNNELNLFLRGTGDRIYRNRSTGGPFGQLLQDEGNGLTSSGLTAAVFASSLRLYARGTDDRLRQR